MADEMEPWNVHEMRAIDRYSFRNVSNMTLIFFQSNLYRGKSVSKFVINHITKVVWAKECECKHLLLSTYAAK